MQIKAVLVPMLAAFLSTGCEDSRFKAGPSGDGGGLDRDGNESVADASDDGGVDPNGDGGGPATDGGTSSSGDGGAGTDGGGVRTDGGVACTGPCCCADSSATCSCYGRPGRIGGPTCYSANACNALMTCPSGYECQNQDCVCTDPAVCGVVCEADGTCPCGLVCGTAHRCIRCSFSSDCAADEICRSGSCQRPPPPGTSPNGASCTVDANCAGGACVYETCTTSCRNNADCPTGLVCNESNNLERNGCVLPAVTACTTGCNGSTQICSLYPTPGGYCTTWCETDADCPQGRCASSTNNRAHPAAPFPLYRVCLPGPPPCDPNEFEVDDEENSGAVLCSEGHGCSRAVDCPGDYGTCLVDRDERGICARAVGTDGGMDGGPECGFDADCAPGDNAQCAVACATGSICSLQLACESPHYVDTGMGTVTDEVTGLLWQKVPPTQCGPSASGCTWAQAQTYCQGLQLGGVTSGWQVPTIQQLFALETAGVAPTIDGSVFTAGANAQVWSSTTVQGAGVAWYLNFGDGTVGPGPVGGLKSVRCVH